MSRKTRTAMSRRINTTVGVHPDPSPVPTRLAVVAAVGIGAFVPLVALLHVLQPGLDPIGRTVSEYAPGRHGWLVQVATLGLGVGSLLLVAALARVTRPTPSRPGAALLAAWSVAVTVAAVFPSDVIDLTTEAELSTSGAVHVLAVLVAVPCFAVGAPLLARGLRRSARWQPFGRPVGALSAIAVAGLVVFVVAGAVTATGTTRPLLGLGERIVLAGYLGWLLGVAVLIPKVARS